MSYDVEIVGTYGDVVLVKGVVPEEQQIRSDWREPSVLELRCNQTEWRDVEPPQVVLTRGDLKAQRAEWKRRRRERPHAK